MKFKTFAVFVGPSVFLMFLFIAAPLVSVLWQSFHLTQPFYETLEVETCTPSFTGQTCVVVKKIRPVLDESGKVIDYKFQMKLDEFLDSYLGFVSKF